MISGRQSIPIGLISVLHLPVLATKPCTLLHKPQAPFTMSLYDTLRLYIINVDATHLFYRLTLLRPQVHQQGSLPLDTRKRRLAADDRTGHKPQV